MLKLGAIEEETSSWKNQAGDNVPRPTIITDHPTEFLMTWHEDGEKLALATLIRIEGAAPRPLGAQMVIAMSGKAAGYLSGGCLEQAIIHEAIDAIKVKQNKLLRFGKGSPFLDVRLPCESSLEIYIDQNLSAEMIAKMQRLQKARQPFWRNTNLKTGTSSIVPITNPSPLTSSKMSGDEFSRAYVPRKKLLLFGAGPTAERIATLASNCGLALEIFSPDMHLRTNLSSANIAAHPLTTPKNIPVIEADRWCAAILAFHEHEWEVPLLAKLIASDCFYIGAIGNKTVQDQRIEALRGLGIPEEQLSRIKRSVGLIESAKDANTLALGILTEIMATSI